MLAVARRRSRRSTPGEDNFMATITGKCVSPDKERGVVDEDLMMANERTPLASGYESRWPELKEQNVVMQ